MDKRTWIKENRDKLIANKMLLWATDDIRITQTYHPDHQAIDQGQDNAGDELVYAIGPGKVLYEGYDRNFYNTGAICAVVELDYGPTPDTKFIQISWHFAYTKVSVGDRVDFGTLLGGEGATGLGSGPHSHDAVFVVNKSYDFMKNPLEALKECQDHFAVNPFRFCRVAPYQKVIGGKDAKYLMTVPTNLTIPGETVEVLPKQLIINGEIYKTV